MATLRTFSFIHFFIVGFIGVCNILEFGITSSYDIVSYNFGLAHITTAFVVIIYPGQVHLHQPASISRDSLYYLFFWLKIGYL